MKCPKCGSENVNVQVVNETNLKKKHNWIYWVFIGWWLEPIMWLCFFLPMLIVKIFKPKKYKTVNRTVSKCVCQNCGNTWNA